MRFRPALFGLGLPAVFLIMAVAFGQQQRNAEPDQERAKPPVQAEPGKGKVLEQSFPPNDMMETAWKVEWDTEIRHGLVIKNAWFKAGPDKEWMQVLGDARVSELFVPYHRGSPRFWDISQYQFTLTRVTAADAGPHGKLHVSNNGRVNIPCVVEELKDRGVIWKDDRGVRRGHVWLLWGCIDAANYRYIVEYGFQDDGCITFRCGATGHNYGGAEFEPHMHNTYWRIDVNLDGPDHNTVEVMDRLEPLEEKVKAATRHTKYNDGKEGGMDWESDKFTMLRVINTQKKNIRGEYFSYVLMPSRMGNSRHHGSTKGGMNGKGGSNEECTLHDFWVTKANPKEIEYRKIQSYCNDENIEDTDIVLWYSSPMFHEPRSEDGEIINGRLVGCTQVAWSGFTLKPSNIFDRSPLYPYPNPNDAKGKGGFGKKGKGGD
jgi:Cu2+-containing amine oxidase